MRKGIHIIRALYPFTKPQKPTAQVFYAGLRPYRQADRELVELDFQRWLEAIPVASRGNPPPVPCSVARPADVSDASQVVASADSSDLKSAVTYGSQGNS